MIDSLLDAGKRRPLFLFEQVETVLVSTEELRGADPDLSSLANLNQPSDYLAALQKAGLEPDSQVLAEFNSFD
ncbi:MAG TPA: hypothetical protein DEP12_02650 [Planctomycetaceae bacterium]|nr:hypothetical protein [Planctomycetaceae bacterium]